MRLLRILVIAVLWVAGARAANAQVAPGGSSPGQVISIQPLSAMLTVYAGEFERRLTPSVTIGIGGTYWNAGDDEFTYTSGDVKLRYYPSAQALQGFAFGGSVGLTSVEANDENTQDSGSASGPNIGVLLEYSWLLGERRNFFVGLGAGAKALLISDDEFSDDSVTLRYPTARISVGFAF